MTTAATADMEYQTAKTSVWWDIENCEVPRGWDAHAIAQNVSSALLKMNYAGPVSITAYGDTNLIPHVVQQALSSTGVGLHHVPAGIKDASDKKILVDMLLWAIDNPAPANYMLISGDRDFSYALHQLRMRRYNILLAQPPQASVPLVAAAKYVWLWTSLASGGPPLTSAESSRLLSNGRGQVSNNEVSKHPVSEQAQSSKTTASTSDAGDAKVHRTRENHIPTGLTQESWSSEVQNGRGASGESLTTCRNNLAHLANKIPKSQASLVESRGTQASVSAKPIQEAELVECKVCKIICSSKDAYKSHTYEKRHQKLKSALAIADYACRLCSVMCSSQSDLDSHLSGKKHVEALNDSKKLQEKVVKKKGQTRETIAEPKSKAEHVCRMCNVACPNQIDFESHLRGKKHAQSEALNDSKKHQEKSIGGKDQPREAIAEPLFQTQNAKEKSKRTRRRKTSLI
ncbi:hypothetical protein AALP_AA8G442300 [Arabis alpina]|uniref:C2H2-type domain-containing protein n=1 Tax=Arabis alpina TaxID=50452 RepID=A0A087GDD4_ARAAL|nr:hypothetical protein AALP_AA8G442300 [Arabis alpina]